MKRSAGLLAALMLVATSGTAHAQYDVLAEPCDEEPYLCLAAPISFDAKAIEPEPDPDVDPVGALRADSGCGCRVGRPTERVGAVAWLVMVAGAWLLRRCRGTG